MPIIRTRADIDDLLGGPTPAEERLLAACAAGEVCGLGDGELPPDEADPDRIIRAEVLRYLILGGCDACRVQGQGVRVFGAHITGTLDLSFQTARGITLLANTRFDDGIEAMQAKLTALSLTGSNVPSLNAEGAEVKGGVFLRKVTATGEISLSGAIIGGQLACDGATFSREGGFALNAQGAEVKGGVCLRKVTATGEIRLSGAIIGGQLSCVGATFSSEGGFALNAQGATIREGLIWRGETTCSTGVANFTAAKISDLVDDLSCWPERGRLILDGLNYDHLHGDLNVAARLKWLKEGSLHGDVFATQPYNQLAQFYDRRGRSSDANKVRIAREKLDRATTRSRWLRRHPTNWKMILTWPAKVACWPISFIFLDLIPHASVGYGYAKFRAVLWLIPLWLIATCLANQAWQAGDFAPNSAVIQTSAAWRDIAQPLMGPPVQNPAEHWTMEFAHGQDWETFNALAYAADLVIPIIDLNQTDAWTPSTNRGPWGQRLWRYGFLLNIMGWIITALGAAALTGVIQKERD